MAEKEHAVVVQEDYEYTLSGLEVPAGYRALAWADAREGQVVWLAGEMDTGPVAYGPHEVYLVSKRELVNHAVRSGRPLFPNDEENLLVKA